LVNSKESHKYIGGNKLQIIKRTEYDPKFLFESSDNSESLEFSGKLLHQYEIICKKIKMKSR